MSSFQSTLKAIGDIADDFKKTLALDGLCSELDLKFSQLQLASSTKAPEVTVTSQQTSKADLMRNLSMDAVQQDIQKQARRGSRLNLALFSGLGQMTLDPKLKHSLLGLTTKNSLIS